MAPTPDTKESILRKITEDTLHLRKVIGQNIRDFRQQQKLTLSELSKLTGLGVDLLNGYEMGKIHISPRELTLIAHALKKSVDALLKF